MIGNDIIDLEIPISPNWKSPRYLNKLFASAEQEVIIKSDKPTIILRLFWSFKEAAYKAHQRRFNLPRKYNPLDFQCEIISEEKNNIQGIVKIKSQTYFTLSKITAVNIHSIATLEKNVAINFKIYQDEFFLKDKLFAEYSLLLKESKYNFRIKKNKHDIPQLFSNDLLTSQVFSLSHHGRFSAFAISLMNC
ncbi:4'-phosphopantetheinyl transferase superfamily protein [Gillisia sp. CAL575]|uniref:4'-phosphopantetheinyl transferase family protein n=1 Tax=Gillisia sp. CAL575 TaxID=985255 RepID=UPI00039F34A3|nr:4'-phosphopantetheinyl transferase superfamily protein [Gillisia sp. CAL575]